MSSGNWPPTGFTHLSIVVPNEIKEWLLVLAAKDERSLTWVVNVILKERKETYGEKKSTGQSH